MADAATTINFGPGGYNFSAPDSLPPTATARVLELLKSGNLFRCVCKPQSVHLPPYTHHNCHSTATPTPLPHPRSPDQNDGANDVAELEREFSDYIGLPHTVQPSPYLSPRSPVVPCTSLHPGGNPRSLSCGWISSRLLSELYHRCARLVSRSPAILGVVASSFR